MQRLVSRELFEMHITFIFHMKRLRIDEPIAMLLIMTVLFSPEHIPVEDKIKISQAQEKYLMLLKKYVTWKFGATAGSRIYPQVRLFMHPRKDSRVKQNWNTNLCNEHLIYS